MFVDHLYVFFGEMSRFLAHFLIGLFGFLILSFMNSFVSILEINPLSVTLFTNIFSYFVDCLSVYGFLCCAETFEFESHLFIFVFIFITLEG